MGENLRLTHLGWAVRSIEAALPAFLLLGFQSEGVICDDSRRGVRILFMKHADSQRIELIEPSHDHSPVSALLNKSGPTPYHVCFSLSRNSWENQREAFKKAGFFEISAPTAAPALGGQDVIFLFSKDIGLVELLFIDEW